MRPKGDLAHPNQQQVLHELFFKEKIMSETVTIRSIDGHELSVYVAKPAGAPIAGLVVIQEIFGVNRHIRSIADGYAKEGFW